MPFNKDQTRCIYIIALVISFLLIVGSIFLHLRQKTHLGRMSFNVDRDRIKPTSGVETVTWLNEYDLTDADNDIIEASTGVDDKVTTEFDISSKQLGSVDNIMEDSKEIVYENNNQDINLNMNEMIDQIEDNIGENSEYEIKSFERDTNACLRCLCMTINQCRSTFCGSGNPCGLYRISKMYWIDGGKPTITGGSTDNEDQDYLTCVNEDHCSATVIRNYYDRYKRDCNKDGKLDCQDQIALHILGPSDCLTDNLTHIHLNRMKSCLIESNLNYFSYFSEEEY